MGASKPAQIRAAGRSVRGWACMVRPSEWADRARNCPLLASFCGGNDRDNLCPNRHVVLSVRDNFKPSKSLWCLQHRGLFLLRMIGQLLHAPTVCARGTSGKRTHTTLSGHATAKRPQVGVDLSCIRNPRARVMVGKSALGFPSFGKVGLT